MKYHIELAATAKADIRQQGQRLYDEVSTAAAEQWLAGLYKTIDTLQIRPLRCPVAAENEKFPEEIRELFYGRAGKRKHKHRIVFTVRDDTDHVLYVRHTARDELEPSCLQSSRSQITSKAQPGASPPDCAFLALLSL